jgi:hypothetical protein
MTNFYSFNRPFVLPTRHWSYKWVAVLAGVIALARCASIVTVYNHTTDELAHIAGSVGLYETGRNLYMVEHPTLPRLVVGLALKIAGVRYPPARGLAGVQSRPDANLAGADIVFRGSVPYWTVLATARLANLFFAAVLLFYVYRLGKYLANPLVGMLATIFVSVDPNFLGHSALVTTDIPAAAGFVAATYYAVRFAARPCGKRAVIAAMALGLAMSCKFTVVLVAPPVLLLIVLRAAWHARLRSGMGGRPFLRATLQHLPRFRYFIAIPVIAFITLWATYLFNIGRLEDQHLFDEEKTWNRIPESIKAARIPMPAMPLGLMFMAALGKTGFPCYFNGHVDLKGHLAYFPEAIALKTPSGAVICFVLALGVFAFAGRKNRHVVIGLCMVLPPSLLMLTAMTGKLQIGIRHILPVLPFIYLFAVFYLQRGRWIYVLVPLILLSAIESARAHPDYLPFFNTLAGGSQNGQKYLADSNLDWGQDMARLAAYIKQSGRTEYTIKVSGVRVADLTQFLGLDPASRDRDVEELRQQPHGLLVLGVNAKVRLEEFKKEKNGSAKLGPDFGWVSGYPLVGRIGESIEVYDLDRKK